MSIKLGKNEVQNYLYVSQGSTPEVPPYDLNHFYPAKFYNMKDSDLSVYFDRGGNKYTNLNNMFQNCDNIKTIPLIDTSNVIDMTGMFSFSNSLETIPLIDTSSVIDMNGMFQYCEKLKEIPLLNTHNVQDMSKMFNNCKSLITIPQLDTSNVTTMESMFQYCTSLTEIPAINTSHAFNLDHMFSGCSNLVNNNNTPIDCSSATSISNIFSSCPKLKSINLINANNLKSINYAFSSCPIANIDLSFPSVEDIGDAFSNAKCVNIKLVLGPVIIDCSNAFGYCGNLESIEVSTIDGSAPIIDSPSVYGMFSYCSKLKALPAFDVSRVQNLRDLLPDYGMDSLTAIHFVNIKSEMDISRYTLFEQPALREIIDNLADLSVEGLPEQILFMSMDMKQKLNPDDEYEAMNKGWKIMER